MPPYLPNMSYNSSDVMLKGRLRTYTILGSMHAESVVYPVLCAPVDLWWQPALPGARSHCHGALGLGGAVAPRRCLLLRLTKIVGVREMYTVVAVNKLNMFWKTTGATTVHN